MPGNRHAFYLLHQVCRADQPDGGQRLVQIARHDQSGCPLRHGHCLPGQGIAARSIIGIGRFYGKAGTRRIKERIERKTRIRPGRYQHLGRACHIHRLGDPEPGI